MATIPPWSTAFAVIGLCLFANGVYAQEASPQATPPQNPPHEEEMAPIYDEPEIFPRGRLFWPLIADPKQMMFRVSGAWVISDLDDTMVAPVALGESFGLFRLPLANGKGAVQIDISGGVFAQFDLLSDSLDLINADYIVAFPLSLRYQDLSVRLRVLHQSSHLGDEYLLTATPPPTRINLSFELFDMLLSYDSRIWRVYGGGSYIFRHDPGSLKEYGVQLGAEVRSAEPFFTFGHEGVGHGVFAIDSHLWQEFGFVPSVSCKTGVELGANDDRDQAGRRLRFLAEAYYGLSPYGQFFAQDIELITFGLGTQINF